MFILICKEGVVNPILNHFQSSFIIGFETKLNTIQYEWYSFSPDHICGQTISASQNPLPVGSNVTFSVHNETTINIGTWLFETNNIVILLPMGNVFIYPNWQDRVTLNRTSAELSIRSLQMSDSGLYKLSGGEPPFDAEITLSVQGR